MMLIFDPDLKEAEQEKLLKEIKETIASAEGKVLKEQKMGKKQMAYSIAKKEFGVYHRLDFSAPAKVVTSLRQKLQLEDKVLRSLVVVKQGAPKEAEGKK